MNDHHILIVEDEERIATLVCKYLELEGYQFTCLNSGEQAVETIKELNPSLCILDIMLPHVSGLEICEQVRRFSQVPIIMLTARVEEIDRLIGFKQGADDYICKPVEPRLLVARINAGTWRMRYSETPIVSPRGVELYSKLSEGRPELSLSEETMSRALAHAAWLARGQKTATRFAMFNGAPIWAANNLEID